MVSYLAELEPTILEAYLDQLLDVLVRITRMTAYTYLPCETKV